MASINPSNLSVSGFMALACPSLQALGFLPAQGSRGLTGCQWPYKHEPSLETVDQINVLSPHPVSPFPFFSSLSLHPSPSLFDSRS